LAEGSLKEPAVWIPIMGAFVTYALMVLMGIGIRFVYRTSFLTTIVTAVASFCLFPWP
jgi:hypothetical protein